MKRIYSILILALVLLFVVFIIQNAETVDLTFLVWGLELSKALLMMLCAGVGFLIGLLVFSSTSKHKAAAPPPIQSKDHPKEDSSVT